MLVDVSVVGSELGDGVVAVASAGVGLGEGVALVLPGDEVGDGEDVVPVGAGVGSVLGDGEGEVDDEGDDEGSAVLVTGGAAPRIAVICSWNSSRRSVISARV